MLQLKNMREWEEVKKVVKRHWFAFITLVAYIIWYLISLISVYIVLGFTLFANLLVVLLSMVAFLLFFVAWLNEELDMFVITNMRIIWVDQLSFLNRTVSECSLKDVQEVNSKSKWLFANMFDFWDLIIQTAWNISNFHMHMAPDPLHQSRDILNLVDEYKKHPTLEN